jgi:hypothetical protein
MSLRVTQRSSERKKENYTKCKLFTASRSDQAYKNPEQRMPGGREEFILKKSFEMSY